MNEINKKSLVRLDGIEILRGFAALSVIFVHVYSLGGFAKYNLFIDNNAKYFMVGVPLFYALSTFSLLYGYDSDFFNESNIKRFYIKRFFRIAPLFYFMILAYLVLKDIRLDLSTILLNLTFTFGLIPTKHTSIVWGGWSVGVEWIFYFIFPLFVLMTRSKYLLSGMFLISAILSVKFSSFTTNIAGINYMHIVKQFLFFVTGAVAYKLIPFAQYIKENHNWIKKAEILFLIAGIALFTLEIIPIELVEVLFFILLLLWAILGYSKLLNNSLTRLLGRFSFSLYLLNPMVIFYLDKFGIYRTIRNSISNQYAAFLLAGILSIMTITLLSAITYYGIEEPGQRLGQKVLGFKKEKHFANLTSRSPFVIKRS